MDWREMAGRPTVRGMRGGDRWNSYAGAWSGGKQFGLSSLEDHWDGNIDPLRGWTIAVCWMLASATEYVIIFF
jgi:protein SYS1